MKKIMMFVGAVTTGIAAGVLVKKYLQKDAEETETTEEDLGVSPVRIYEDDNDQTSDENSDDVPSLKADAINHGYKPIEY